MSVLDSVVRLREIEERQSQNTAEAFIKGLGLMQTKQQLGMQNNELALRAKQLEQDYQKTSILNEIENKKLQVGLAEKGLKWGDTGQIVRDDSLKSPLEQLIEQGKAATASNAIYEAGGPRLGLGGPSNAQNGGVQAEGDLIPTDFDAFGRPKAFKSKTAMGEEAKMAGEKARIEKQAKGVDESYSGRIANYNDVLTNEQELFDILYQKNDKGEHDFSKFSKGIQWSVQAGGTPILSGGNTENAQRAIGLLKDLKNAHKLTLTTRGVGEQGGNDKLFRSGVDLNLATNPKAFAKNLQDTFNVIKQAKSGIEGGKVGGGEETNSSPVDDKLLKSGFTAEQISEYKKLKGIK